MPARRPATRGGRRRSARPAPARVAPSAPTPAVAAVASCDPAGSGRGLEARRVEEDAVPDLDQHQQVQAMAIEGQRAPVAQTVEQPAHIARLEEAAGPAAR